jgi:hypothetical protein
MTTIQRRHEYQNGDVYDGTWDGRKKQGQGIFTWVSGARYEGAFLADERSGLGTLKYADGSVYTGSWY